MKTVELSAALGQAQVVENLKNFVGVDAQGAAALMTPERLAAVAGGMILNAKRLTSGDLNDYKYPCILMVGSSDVANKPTSFVYIMVLACSESKDVVQIGISISLRELYIRGLSNDVWNDWIKIGA